MNSETFKYAYAFALLAITVGWAVFCVSITLKALMVGGSANILGAAGADFLLGALTTWDSLIVQHYFRKKVGF